MSKRRKGFPSETKVKRGARVVHGEKELEERLGRNDLCPCGSGRRFKTCCRNAGCFRRREPAPLLSENESSPPGFSPGGSVPGSWRSAPGAAMFGGTDGLEHRRRRVTPESF